MWKRRCYTAVYMLGDSLLYRSKALHGDESTHIRFKLQRVLSCYEEKRFVVGEKREHICKINYTAKITRDFIYQTSRGHMFSFPSKPCAADQVCKLAVSIPRQKIKHFHYHYK